jgi:hypothetical protein
MVILTDSLSVTSKNAAEAQDAEFLCWFVWNYVQIIIYLSTLTVEADVANG